MHQNQQVCKFQNLKKDGSTILSYPILNAKGELIYVIIQHEDITERKLAEAEGNKIKQGIGEKS